MLVVLNLGTTKFSPGLISMSSGSRSPIRMVEISVANGCVDNPWNDLAQFCGLSSSNDEVPDSSDSWNGAVGADFAGSS